MKPIHIDYRLSPPDKTTIHNDITFISSNNIEIKKYKILRKLNRTTLNPVHSSLLITAKWTYHMKNSTWARCMPQIYLKQERRSYIPNPGNGILTTKIIWTFVISNIHAGKLKIFWWSKYKPEPLYEYPIRSIAPWKFPKKNKQL